MRQVGVLEDNRTPIYHAPQFRTLGTEAAIRGPTGQLLAYYDTLARIPSTLPAGLEVAIGRNAVPNRYATEDVALVHTLERVDTETQGSAPAVAFPMILLVGLVLLIIAVATYIIAQAYRTFRAPRCGTSTFDVSEKTAAALAPSCEVAYFDKETGELVHTSKPPESTFGELGGVVVFAALGVAAAVVLAKAGPGLLGRAGRRGGAVRASP
jgi:hypothetical protein